MTAAGNRYRGHPVECREERLRVIAGLRQEGWTIYRIAKLMGISYTRVRQLILQIKSTRVDEAA